MPAVATAYTFQCCSEILLKGKIEASRLANLGVRRDTRDWRFQLPDRLPFKGMCYKFSVNFINMSPSLHAPNVSKQSFITRATTQK